MFSERTSVGLDVHARSTTAWALDGLTGEVFSERLDADTLTVMVWVLPFGPICPIVSTTVASIE